MLSVANVFGSDLLHISIAQKCAHWRNIWI